MHMVAARLGCQSTMVGTRWDNFCHVTRRVTCTWWLLGLTVKAPWLGPGRPIFALAAWTGLKNATLALYGVHFWQGRLLGL